MNAEAGFFRLEDRISILYLFSGREVACSASSSNSGFLPELSSFSSEDSSSSFDSGEGSFVFFLELLFYKGSELVILDSKSFSVFFAIAATGVVAGAAVGILILTTSAITCVIGCC